MPLTQPWPGVAELWSFDRIDGHRVTNRNNKPKGATMKATVAKWSGPSALALVVTLGTSQAASGAVWCNPRSGSSFDNDVAAFEKADQTNPPPRDAIFFGSIEHAAVEDPGCVVDCLVWRYRVCGMVDKEDRREKASKVIRNHHG
jgi:hypothetical protein